MTRSDRSLFWIEPARIAALLERVEARDGTLPTVAPSPRPSPPEASGAPQLDVPDGPLETRLEALFDWLAGVVESEAVFVADDEGLSLVDRDARPELVAASAAVAQRWAEVRLAFPRLAGPSLAIDLDGGERLHLVLADSPWGRLQLGFVTRHAVARETVVRVGEAFQKTVADPAVADPAVADPTVAE